MNQLLNNDTTRTAMIIVELMIDGSAGKLANEWYSSGLPEGMCNRRDHIVDVARAIEVWCHDLKHRDYCDGDERGDFHDEVDGCWDWEIMPIVIEYACRPVEDFIVFSLDLALEALDKMFKNRDRQIL